MAERGESRDRLLAAAVTMFASRGYDRTTTREIAQQAGVDPALIARYFGSKAALYLAAVRSEGSETPPDLLHDGRLASLLKNIDQRGQGPILRAVVHEHEDPSLESAAREALHEKLVNPLRERFEAIGAVKPELLAEVAVAAFTGVAMARTSGMFGELAAATPDELAALLHKMLAALTAGAPARI